jgi:hypothetical protein
MTHFDAVGPDVVVVVAIIPGVGVGTHFGCVEVMCDVGGFDWAVG